jgi:hypothetical protein
MAKIDIDEPLDSDQMSTMSGKDTPDPEKEIMAVGHNTDIEKQAQGQVESEPIAKPREEGRDPDIVEFDGPVRVSLRYSLMLVSHKSSLHSNMELA